MKKKVQFNVYLPKSLAVRLVKEAWHTNKSLSAMVEKVLSDFMDLSESKRRLDIPDKTRGRKL